MQSGWLLVVGLVMALAEGVPRLSELHWISLLVLRNLQHLLDPLGALVHSSLALFDSHRHIVVQESMRECPEFLEMQIHSHPSTFDSAYSNRRANLNESSRRGSFPAIIILTAGNRLRSLSLIRIGERNGSVSGSPSPT